MKITSRKSALKDVEKLPSEIKPLILSEIERLQNAASLGEMGNVEKLSGHKNRYKLKKDNFRIILEKTETGCELVIIGNRKDVYNRLNKNK